MESKMFFVVAVACIAQAFDMRPVPNQSQLSPEFMEAYENMDDFGADLSFSAMELALRNPNPKTVTCYDQQKQSYSTIVRKFTVQTQNVANDLGKNLQKDLHPASRKFTKRAQTNLRKMAYLMNTYPQQLNTLIADKKFEEAADLMRETRVRLEFSDIKFTENIRHLKKQSPEDANQAEAKFKAFRTVAKEDSKMVNEKFSKCFG